MPGRDRPLGARRRRVGADLVEAEAQRPVEPGRARSGETLTARSTSPGPASTSPWWRSGSSMGVHRVGEALRQLGVAGPVHVQVGRVQRRRPEADRLAVDQPGRPVTGRRRHPGAVELVPGDPRPRRASRVSAAAISGAVAQGQPRPSSRPSRRSRRPSGRRRRDGTGRAGRRTRRRSAARPRPPPASSAPQRVVGGQLGGVHLGEAAAEVEPGRALRQVRVASAGRTSTGSQPAARSSSSVSA